MKTIKYLMTAIILTLTLILYVEEYSSTPPSSSTIQSSRIQNQVLNNLKLN